MSAPSRLIDPDGEGVYVLDASDFGAGTSLLQIAVEFFGDYRQWRDIDYELIWMREGDDDHWYPSRWRWWHAFLPSARQPTAYAYLTPKPDAL